MREIRGVIEIDEIGDHLTAIAGGADLPTADVGADLPTADVGADLPTADTGADHLTDTIVVD